MSAKHTVSMFVVFGLAACSGAPVQPPAVASLRHLASPDWRDQIIYFAMIDRFADGDPGNNHQGAGEYDPSRNSHYSGGDLAGLQDHLDYIDELGATALWITPPVANQWWSPGRQYTGYHGYWAEDFKSVDRHYGTLGDYQQLAQALHARGMYLVQDIVVNHVGNFFGYGEDFVAGDVERGYVKYEERGRGQGAGGMPCRMSVTQGGFESLGSQQITPQTPTRNKDRNDGQLHPLPPAPCPASAPSQPPFNQNDPRDPAQRAAAIYHWTPDIRDYQDPNQEANFQMGGLDDLNTENPAVRRALRDSYGYWIREVGIDAFRVDTAFYVPPAYFEDFLYADDSAAPGIDRVARNTGRQQFFSFGEGFAVDPPYAEKAARKIDTYMRSSDGRSRLQGMINFPLYGSLSDVFARGRPTAELAHRIESMMGVHENPHLLPSFLDNHDVDRFLAGGSEAALKQALLALMTLPGIPVIYYGTEQGFREQRASMFAAGYGSGGRDHFDTRSELFQFTQSAIKLRRSHPALSRGTPELLHSDRTGAGALAWRMRDGDQQLIVVFNTADEATLLDHLPTGLAAGTRLTRLFALGAPESEDSTRDRASLLAPAEPAPTIVGTEGALTLVLPPRSAWVWEPLPGDPAEVSAPDPDPQQADSGACAAPGESGPCPVARAALTIDPTPTTTYAGDFELSGSALRAQRLQMVVDGRLADAQRVDVDVDGRWRARIDTRAMLDPLLEHRLVARDVDSGAVSSPIRFRVERTWQLLADVADPAGDDQGPDGRYRYPSDPAFVALRPNDLQHVTVHGSGGALRLTLTLNELLSTWNPPNGFDHVAFTIYLQLPDRGDGARAMPLQFGELPQGMRWHYRVHANGWSNALFSAAGASASQDGAPVIPTATVLADRKRRTVSFTIPSASLGNPASLSGARIHISTWDYDGGYRELAALPGPYTYGGGAPDQPRVMDEVLISLP